MIEVHKTPIAAPDFQTPGPLPNFKGFYPSKGKVFIANQQTGTGASQNIAHGLGAAPAAVLAIPTDGGTVVYGTHTSTNAVVTVTAGKKFDVVAWL